MGIDTVFWVKVKLGYLNVCWTALFSCSLQVNSTAGVGFGLLVVDTILVCPIAGFLQV